MRGLSLLKRTAGERSFYCRMTNRMVGACTLNLGPEGCNLRRDCPAYSALESTSQVPENPQVHESPQV